MNKTEELERTGRKETRKKAVLDFIKEQPEHFMAKYCRSFLKELPDSYEILFFLLKNEGIIN